MSLEKQIWIDEVRIFLDCDDTKNLHERSLLTENISDLKTLLKRAKKVFSSNVIFLVPRSPSLAYPA